MTLNTNPRQYFTILGLVVVLIVLLSPRQAATAQSGRTVYLPLVQKNYKTPPKPTTSVYLRTKDTATIRNLGRQYGSAGTSGLVILDYGNPRMFSGTAGTKLISQPTNLNITEITDVTKSFIIGYWDGYWNAGGSSANPSALIRIGIGLNNCGLGPQIPLTPQIVCIPGGTNMPYSHGRQWAQMAREISDWVALSGYSSRVSIVSAYDAEPGYNFSADTRTWLSGYNDYFICNEFTCYTPSLIYDFGSCDGCQYARADGTLCTPSDTACLTMSYLITTTTGDLNWSWQLEDIRFVAWAAPYSYPVPEIYFSSNVRQWYGVSRYNYDITGAPIRLEGVMTQSEGYTPEAGWLALWGRVWDDPATQIPNIPYLTKIVFQ